MKIEIEAIAYHRNVISGLPFHVVLFKFEEFGRKHNMVATVFDDEGTVAVLDRDQLTIGECRFGYNSWRGDDFETDLRAACNQYQETRQ